MRSRGVWMLIVASATGLVAAVMAASWMQQQGGGRAQIAVAASDIELGGRITPELVRMVDWPPGSKPPGAFDQPGPLAGRVVLTALQRGEPILAARLAPEGSKAGLSAVVADGKRAMTVRVNDVIGVAGFALPGTFVDIMVNTQDDAARRGNESAVSKIVLERILVLAVAQEADRDTSKPKVVNAVTLEVTPEQAELLDLVRSVGTLSLVLRNQSDPKAAATTGASRAELLTALGHASARPATPAESAAAPPVKRVAPARPPLQLAAAVPDAPAPPAAPPRPSQCVEVIRGVSKVTECF